MIRKREMKKRMICFVGKIESRPEQKIAARMRSSIGDLESLERTMMKPIARPVRRHGPIMFFMIILKFSFFFSVIRRNDESRDARMMPVERDSRNKRNQ